MSSNIQFLYSNYPSRLIGAGGGGGTRQPLLLLVFAELGEKGPDLPFAEVGVEQYDPHPIFVENFYLS